MKTQNLASCAIFVLALLAGPALSAQVKDANDVKMVGGAAMYPSKNIVDNAVNSKVHTTLVAAVRAAELVGTLQGDGPFTVFAPTDKAFEKLPEGTVPMLLEPQNKAKLQAVLTYHVVAGDYSAKDLIELVKQGNGVARLKTVQGGDITITRNGMKLMLQDSAGTVSHITISDVNQANGVIHVVDTVVLPSR